MGLNTKRSARARKCSPARSDKIHRGQAGSSPPVVHCRQLPNRALFHTANPEARRIGTSSMQVLRATLPAYRKRQLHVTPVGCLEGNMRN